MASLKPNFNEETGNNDKVNIYNSLLCTITRLRVVSARIFFKDITSV